eukprot:973861-Prorocentrum_minimum.AAC.1
MDIQITPNSSGPGRRIYRERRAVSPAKPERVRMTSNTGSPAKGLPGGTGRSARSENWSSLALRIL